MKNKKVFLKEQELSGQKLNFLKNETFHEKVLAKNFQQMIN